MRTYTLTPRRYSFACRYRLGTASNLVMYVRGRQRLRGRHRHQRTCWRPLRAWPRTGSPRRATWAATSCCATTYCTDVFTTAWTPPSPEPRCRPQGRVRQLAEHYGRPAGPAPPQESQAALSPLTTRPTPGTLPRWATHTDGRAQQPRRAHANHHRASTGPLDCKSLDCTFMATSGGVSTQRGLRRRDKLLAFLERDGGAHQCSSSSTTRPGADA